MKAKTNERPSVNVTVMMPASRARREKKQRQAWRGTHTFELLIKWNRRRNIYTDKTNWNLECLRAAKAGEEVSRIDSRSCKIPRCELSEVPNLDVLQSASLFHRLKFREYDEKACTRGGWIKNRLPFILPPGKEFPSSKKKVRRCTMRLSTCSFSFPLVFEYPRVVHGKRRRP